MDEGKRLDLYRQVHRAARRRPARGLSLERRPVLGHLDSALDGVEISPIGLFHFLPGPLGWRPAAAPGDGSVLGPMPVPSTASWSSISRGSSRARSARCCSADLGARVIKVEHPGGRRRHARMGAARTTPASGLSAYYLSINRNKESIALDLARRMAASRSADPRPPRGRARRELPAGRPREVRAVARRACARRTRGSSRRRSRGSGGRGPTRPLPGFDLLAQAGAGSWRSRASSTASRRRSAWRSRTSLAGCFLPSASRRRCAGRERTGAGRTSRRTSSRRRSPSLINVAQSALVTGAEAERHGNAHPQIVPYRPFPPPTASFVLAVGTDPQFARLAGLVGRPEWATDPAVSRRTRRGSRTGRSSRRELAAIFRREPRDAWLARCRAAGVPAGPVRGPLEALDRRRPARLAAASGRARRRPLRRVSDSAVTGVASARLEFLPALDARRREAAQGVRRCRRLPSSDV